MSLTDGRMSLSMTTIMVLNFVRSLVMAERGGELRFELMEPKLRFLFPKLSLEYGLHHWLEKYYRFVLVIVANAEN